MTDKRKKKTRELAAKLGMPYQAAHNLLARGAGHGGDGALQALLARLHVDNTFAVLTGKVPAVGQSTTLEVAREHSLDLIRNPKWYAETGTVEMLLTREEHQLLVANGAADDRVTQVIRSFRNEHGTTFSVRCEECHRWIWCGKEEREASCVCGEKYRVVFDLAAVHHWSQEQWIRCMDCGVRFGPTEPQEQRSPWQHPNQWQIRCHRCSQPQEPIDSAEAR